MPGTAGLPGLAPGAPGRPGGSAVGGGLLGLPDGSGVPGLAGVVDLGGLQNILDAAREGDEAAGDPLGQDAAVAVLPGAADAWPAAELAATAAEGMAPGPGLGYWAGCFAPGELSDYALPGAAAACRRLASWAQAAELEIVAEVAARAAARDASVPAGPGGLPAGVPQEAAAEIALALRMSQYGASCWTGLAITLAGRLAATGAALRAGAIDLTRARLIAEATGVLEDRAAQLAEARVLPGAGTKTPAQLRAALRRAVIAVDPDAAERRREQAERRAKVGLYGDEDGTATLSGQNLPGAHAAAAMARITALARAMKTAGAGGGIDLLRAQVFTGLLLGTLPLIPPAQDAPPDDPHHRGDGPGTPADGPSEPDGPGDGPGGPGDSDDPGGPGDPADPADGPGGPDDPKDPDDPEDAAGPGGPGEPSGPAGGNRGVPGDENPGVPGDGGPADGPGDPADPCDPGDPGGPADANPGDPGGPADANPGDPGGPADANPGGPADANPGDPGGPADANSGDPGDPGDLGDQDDPDCPDSPYSRGSPGGGRDPCDRGPAGRVAADDPGGPDGSSGPGQAPISAWPGLPVPGQAPAGLAPSGTGALAGLPRGPAGPGLLHLTVPWRTLVGILAEPGQLSRLGPVTPQTARHLADAAARDPGTSWKVIITDGAGRAIAITQIPRPRARQRGRPPTAGLVSQVTLVMPATLVRDPGLRRPPVQAVSPQDKPQSPASPGPPNLTRSAGIPGTPPGQDPLASILAAALKAARLATADADADATVPGVGAGTARPGGCTHRRSSPAYRPPPRLREYVAARDQTCRSPVCRQPASRADQDHTIPYHQGGRTCDCNLGGACRTHHRLKQRPGWQLTQSQPGTFAWTTPAGRTYTQTPDPYPG